jgi:hypothetical protein
MHLRTLTSSMPAFERLCVRLAARWREWPRLIELFVGEQWCACVDMRIAEFFSRNGDRDEDAEAFIGAAAVEELLVASRSERLPGPEERKRAEPVMRAQLKAWRTTPGVKELANRLAAEFYASFPDLESKPGVRHFVLAGVLRYANELAGNVADADDLRLAQWENSQSEQTPAP